MNRISATLSLWVAALIVLLLPATPHHHHDGEACLRHESCSEIRLTHSKADNSICDDSKSESHHDDGTLCIEKSDYFYEKASVRLTAHLSTGKWCNGFSDFSSVLPCMGRGCTHPLILIRDASIRRDQCHVTLTPYSAPHALRAPPEFLSA